MWNILVTILGNPRKTIDISEVADFSANQQQRANVETSRKKSVQLVPRPVGGLREKASHPKAPKGASLGTAEEGPTSAPKWYKRGRFGSSDIGTWHPCRRCRPRFLELRLAEFDDGAEALSS